MMKYTFYLVLFSFLGFIACNTDEEPVNEVEIPDGYTLLWQDEFDGADIDGSNWSYENGDGTDYGLPAGWGNNELQLYREENASITTDGSESVLQLTATKEGEESYFSSKIVSKDKFSMRFGRIDVRAMLPQGQGIWPAIWMLGDNIDEVDWPGCGEIDIMELLGDDPSKVYSTVHYVNFDELSTINPRNIKGEEQGTYTLPSGTFSDSYHVFSLDWTPEQMTFFVDGNQLHQVTIDEHMNEFLREFYLIANVAVGGFWPGNPDESTSFPQSMMIDYIRVFEKTDFVAPESPALDIEAETLGQLVQEDLVDNAIKVGFDDFGEMEIISYGGGGEPVLAASETAVDGDLSLALGYPGTSWGGGYIEMSERKDLSAYSTLKVSLHIPDGLVNAEIKVESGSSDATLFLADLSGTEVENGFLEFSIPLADFEGVDFTDLRIPFAMWNPTDADGNFIEGTVLVDNLYLE